MVLCPDEAKGDIFRQCGSKGNVKDLKTDMYTDVEPEMGGKTWRPASADVLYKSEVVS
jgi:hypothetical protein